MTEHLVFAKAISKGRTGPEWKDDRFGWWYEDHPRIIKQNGFLINSFETQMADDDEDDDETVEGPPPYDPSPQV